MKKISVAVFCGSRSGAKPEYQQHARLLGEIIARRKIHLIYGGGSSGLMGVLADACLANGGHVTGYIPQILLDKEKKHPNIQEIIVCKDMHERKRKMFEHSQLAVILPGGFGTLDELFEMITWNQLTIHDIPICIVNTCGFYDSLKQHIDVMHREDFLYTNPQEALSFVNDPQELENYFSRLVS
ncbi:MAG: TIGR00730 family Rossman fold protein [Chitinophagaceae bacterium]|nr:TIGR00730 family Rossman fold protein [Chitinophagaceae bacterium]